MVWQIVGVLAEAEVLLAVVESAEVESGVEMSLVAAGSIETEVGYLEDRYFAELAEVY